MHTIRNYLQKVLKSTFIRNLSITFLENVITKILAFFITLILARNLGPEGYGIYSFIFVNIFVLSLLFDFGMENTAIRFSNRDKRKQNSIFGLYFLIKLLILIILTMILLLFGKNILLNMHKPELIKYIPVFLIGFVSESIFYVNDTFLQCIQKFNYRALINISRYSLVFIYAIFLYFNKIVSLKYATIIFIIPIFFIFFFIPRYYTFLKSYLKDKLSKNLISEIFHYEKWMSVLSIGNSISARVDLYMLSIWVSFRDLGIYSAAFNLLSVITFLPSVLGKVMLPKMAETDIKDLFDLTIRITKPLLVLCCLMLFTLPIFPFIVPVLFGSKYNESVVIVQILSVSALISFVVLPIEQSMYPLGKPKQLSALRYIQLAIVIILCLFTIPFFGMIWAAISTLISRILYSLLLIMYFYKEKKSFELSIIDELPILD